MTLKRIRLVNMQCHKELDIELPETGVIAFTGNNNNGKSVVTKVLRRLITNQFQSRPRARASLINRNATYGEALFVRSDDAKLLLHLTRDASNTYLTLEIPGETPITRYLSDKAFPDLCSRFGWHYSPDRDITLNIAELDQALLFFATSNACNYDILDTAMSDPIAAQSLEVSNNLINEAVKIKDIAAQKITACNTTIASLQMYDIEVESQRSKTLSVLYNVLSKIYIPVLPDIQSVPQVKLLRPYKPKMPTIVYPPIYKVTCSIPDIAPLANEISLLKNKVCPLCGRRFINDSSGSHPVCN